MLALSIAHPREAQPQVAHVPAVPQGMPDQRNYCRMALVLAQNEELAMLVVAMGPAVAPSVSMARPIEPFWPAVLVCMRPPTPEEQALRDAQTRDTMP